MFRAAEQAGKQEVVQVRGAAGEQEVGCGEWGSVRCAALLQLEIGNRRHAQRMYASKVYWDVHIGCTDGKFNRKSSPAIHT